MGQRAKQLCRRQLAWVLAKHTCIVPTTATTTTTTTAEVLLLVVGDIGGRNGLQLVQRVGRECHAATATAEGVTSSGGKQKQHSTGDCEDKAVPDVARARVEDVGTRADGHSTCTMRVRGGREGGRERERER